MGIFDKLKIKKDSSQPAKKTAKADQNNVKPVSQKVGAVTGSVEKEAKIKDDQKNKSSDILTGILIRPIITEKAGNLNGLNQYVFEVNSSANKIEIARAIEAKYKVKPIKINIINNSGKSVRFGRHAGRTKSWKKAIINLPQGQTIDIYEGV